MITYLMRQLRALAPIFRPPFDGLWLAILLYFFWCFLVHPKGQILRGNFPDPDDYMYLDQVLDWVKGQGWFDNIQHRLDPPTGGPIHFSRLPQIPMAALILLFEALGLPPRGAATIMAIIEPLFLLAGFFQVIRWTAKSLIPSSWAGATAFVALFATGLIEMYVPGHVDHHGLVELLIAGALGCGLRMMLNPHDMRWGVATGAILALSLTVALEVLPWIIVISGWFGIWAMIRGGKAARNGLGYGLGLYVASALLLLTARSSSHLGVLDVAAYSLVYVYFTGAIAVSFAAIALGDRAHPAWRWVLGVAVAGVTGAMFLSRFPDLLGGPWGGVNPALAKLILNNVTEAAPMIKLKSGWLLHSAVVSFGPLLAFGANCFFLRSGRTEERWAWILNAVLLATSFLLAAFYQIRFVGPLGLFMLLPLTALLQRGWFWNRANHQGRAKVLWEIGLLLLVGPLPGVLIPATIDGRSFNIGVLLFPVQGGSYSACDMYGLEQVLRSPQLAGGKPKIIMNTMGLGPELMFRTPHMVMSAPYHEAVGGNLDAVRFFSATDPAKAEAIVRARHVDLIVTCQLIPGMFMNLDSIREALPDTADTVKKAKNAKPSPPFILKLIGGNDLPAWLKPVQSPVMRNYYVYEVVPEALSDHKAGKDR